MRTPKAYHDLVPKNEECDDLRDGQLAPNSVEGGNLPPVIHDLNEPLNQEDERETNHGEPGHEEP
jgi:hypothetical protein